MKKRLFGHRHLINVLATASPKLRKAILNQADKSLIQTLTESCHNVANGNIKISPCNLRKLKRYKSQIRKITCPKSGWQLKKKVLIQSGGFLPILMPIISSVLGGIVSHFLPK